MHALYHPALNGGKASDWLRPIPCQREGDKLPKGVYQSGDGYSTGVHLSEHLACIPSSRREASHVSSQGKEAVSVTHDIYIDYFFTHFNLSLANGSHFGPFRLCSLVRKDIRRNFIFGMNMDIYL